MSSWFNINVNESLSTLKGQISTVSHAVQDALKEGILNEQEQEATTSQSSPTEDDAVLRGLEEANSKIDELNALCQSKEDEINSLRKQIETFSKTKPAEESVVKSEQHGNEQTANIDDSWFWESEKTQSSTSSSRENEVTTNANANSATNIVSSIGSGDDRRGGADETLNASSTDDDRIVERLRRSIEEKDFKLQNLADENIRLSYAYDQVKETLMEMDRKMEELEERHNEELTAMSTWCNQIRQENEAKEKANQQNDNVEDKLRFLTEENARLMNEIATLKTTIEQKSKEVSELNKILDICDVLDVTETKDTSSTELMRRQQELDEIKSRLSILNEVKNQYDGNVVRLSAVVEEKTELEKQMSKLRKENENLLREVRVTREAVEKLEELQKTLDEINSEKEQNELAFVALQEDESVLQREFNQLKEDKEKLATELESAKSSQDECLSSLETKCEKLNAQLRASQENYDELLTKQLETQTMLEEQQRSFDLLKSEAIEAESRLVEENMLFQKKINDLEAALQASQLATAKSAATSSGNDSDDTIRFDDVRDLISKTVNFTAPQDAHSSFRSYFDAFLQSIKETHQHLADIEKNRNDLMRQFETMSNEKANLQHDYKTLKVDLHHYEAEVAELMKNNEILLVELEKIKSGKLETISEQNEEIILKLEKQIEDCSKLNQSLEDEYENIRRRLDEKEEEKYELLEKIANLEEELESQQKRERELGDRIEAIEAEKTKAQQDIELLATQQESQSEQENVFADRIHSQKIEIDELKKQLENLSGDHASLVQKIEPLQAEKKRLQNEIVRMQEAENRLKIELSHLNSEFEEVKNSNSNDAQAVQTLNGRIASLNEELGKLQIASESKERSLTEKIVELEQKLQTVDLTSQTSSDAEKIIEILTREKTELVAAVQMKHNENLQYHAKIQELNQLLATMQQAVIEREQQALNCANCATLGEQLNGYAAEMTKLNDQIEFLKEKSDVMTKNLMIEQTNQKLLQQEKVQINDEKQQLLKDLNRLREHLVEVENAHTQELIELQKTLEETRQEMATMQEAARKSNTAYTSASIRANQHSETLHAQYTVLQQQRDDLVAKLTAADDREAKNQAALTNLQCALEQFQRDKERDVASMNHRIRDELVAEIEHKKQLQNEIDQLKQQLEESKAGLLAAARISDQLEISQVTNSALKEELRKTQERLHEAQQKLYDNESNQADRVDKSLLKNLVIGYIVAPVNDKPQILKLISSVLDFNQGESDRVGLNKAHSGWLDSILHGQRATSPGKNNSSKENYNKEGLVQAFVKFLETESQPRNDSPTLLNIVHPPANPTSAIATNPTATTSNAMPEGAVQPILLPDAMFQSFGAPRSSSSILKDILSDS